MPPKKSKKAQAETKKKVVEDKTFGLKNKNKSKKVQQYVNTVKQQAQGMGSSDKAQKDAAAEKAAKAARKKAEEDKKAELAALFAPGIKQQKVPFGVDPKTVLCAFFKAAQCNKGAKCKFSHDLNIERKAEKINLYADARDEEKAKDTMDGWDQEKLEKVIGSKHEKTNVNNPTEIVCKHFIEAVETRKYGWFWVCPTGDTCKYRHALPPGFVLRPRETPEERMEREEREKANEITIEDFLERERHNLGDPSTLTPISEESFAKWKADRKAKQREEDAKEEKRKADAYAKKAGTSKAGVSFSGRDLFQFNPDWADALDDDDDGAMEEYEREDDSDEIMEDE
ncbi:MAG: hypothetical protein SGCHY_005105 [Lobulomycetales sp.]